MYLFVTNGKCLKNKLKVFQLGLELALIDLVD